MSKGRVGKPENNNDKTMRKLITETNTINLTSLS